MKAKGIGEVGGFIIRALILVAFSISLRAEVLCGTWNLQWFPSGRAEHRASARVEKANMEDAAELIRQGFDTHAAVTNIILFFQELRGYEALSNLVEHVRYPHMKVASASAFRERDNRLGWQQCGIATTLPVLEAGWSYWKRPRGVYPPRGYAWAILDGGVDGPIACYCVHLKSNYGAKLPEQKAANTRKRESCADQLVTLSGKVKSPDGRPITRIIVAGDFNVDLCAEGIEERTGAILQDAGFVNNWKAVAKEARGTHVGWRNFADSTLDYIFTRGFGGFRGVFLSKSIPLSDHRMAWAVYE